MIPFRRASSRYAVTPQPTTPYQRAAQAWDERIGSARVQARNWRLMAFGCLALAGVATGGVVWQSSRGQITPWVVEVDALGHARAAGPATRWAQPADAQVAYHLAQFISDVRSIPADPVVLRAAWLRAFDYAAGDGAQAVAAYAREADPFRRLAREQVTVDVASVVRASPTSFRVEWTERRFEAGAPAGLSRWTAILTVELKPPRDPEGLRANPLGVHVTALSWSKELS